MVHDREQSRSVRRKKDPAVGTFTKERVRVGVIRCFKSELIAFPPFLPSDPFVNFTWGNLGQFSRVSIIISPLRWDECFKLSADMSVAVLDPSIATVCRVGKAQ